MSKHFDLEEFANNTFDNVPDDINLPPGEYMFEVLRARVDATEKDEPSGFIELTMRPVGVLGGDLSEDMLSSVYPVKDRLYLTDAARKFTKRTLTKGFNLDLEGKSYLQIAEELIGASVKGITKLEAYKTRAGEERQQVKVVKYQAA